MGFRAPDDRRGRRDGESPCRGGNAPAKTGRNPRRERGQEPNSRRKTIGNCLREADQDAKSPSGEFAGRLKYQRVNAHREAAQFNGIVSGRPAPA
jgi:hypothetical protein